MNAAPCPSPLGTAALLEYWLGECDAAQEARLEEHLFACRSCAAVWQTVAELGDAVRALVESGGATAVVPQHFVDRLKSNGLHINEYHLPHNGSVHCTIAPNDDLVLAHVAAPLADVKRLDLLFEDVDAQRSHRATDVGFDPSQGEIVLMPRARDLRALGIATQRVTLLSVTDQGDRVLGQYLFHHRPFGA